MYIHRTFYHQTKNASFFLLGGFPSPPAKTLLILPIPGKIPPVDFPHQIFVPPPKINSLPNQMTIVIIKKKTSFLGVVNAPVPFLFQSYSLYTQVMLILILIDVQYSQKAVFRFEKGSISQNHSSSGSHHSVKKYLPAKFLSLGGRKFFTHHLTPLESYFPLVGQLIYLFYIFVEMFLHGIIDQTCKNFIVLGDVKQVESH